MSLSGALATASRALQVFSTGIQVAGSNISNASTPGYVRDKLVLTPSPSSRTGPVLVGTGVNAVGVKQDLDTFLEGRLYKANSDAKASGARNSVHQQLQVALNELSDTDLSTSLQKLTAEFQKLANSPEDPGQRSIVVQQGTSFANDVKQLRERVDQYSLGIDDNIRSLTAEANDLIKTVSQLNPRISALEANGLDDSDAGSLRVQRLNALNRLSEIIPVKAIERPSGAVDVYTGGEYLVLDGSAQYLETFNTAIDDGTSSLQVRLSSSKYQIESGSGELFGLVEGRDSVLGGFVSQLDQVTKAVIDQVNRVHAGGEGLVGFKDVTGANAVTSTSAALNNAGLSFPPSHGSFTVKIRNTQTGEVNSRVINVDLDGIGSDTSLASLVTDLTGVPNLTATITSDQKLRLQAGSGYEVRFGNDTSGLLAGLGINTFFTGSDSLNVAVNSNLSADSRLLASGQGAGPSDSSNALLLTKFADQSSQFLGGQTVTKFYTQLVSQVGQSAAAEKALSEGFSAFQDSLKTQREQRSGVNLDEETLAVLQLQKSYQASARVITVIDDLLNALLRV